MARDEHNRENLLAEATALAERVSLRIADYESQVVIGFRRDGSASFFFGTEPVYQFTSRGKLRRAYADEFLFKAEHGRLVALRRQRTDRAIELVRHALSAAETSAFLATMQRHLDATRGALATDTFGLVGEVPPGANVVDRVRRWLDSFARGGEIADSPRAG